MSAGRAPDGGGIGQVVSSKTGDAHPSLPLLNRLNQSFNDFATSARRMGGFGANIQMPRNQSEEASIIRCTIDASEAAQFAPGTEVHLAIVAFQIVFFAFLNDPAMEAAIEQRLSPAHRREASLADEKVRPIQPLRLPASDGAEAQTFATVFVLM